MTQNDHDIDESPEESFAELFEKSVSPVERLEPGRRMDATILKIGADWIFLDVGQKGEGVLDKKELLAADGTLSAREGDTLAVYFLSARGGELRFTTRLGGPEVGQAQLEEAFRNAIPVEGRVEKETKGGYEVKVAGARAFCPFSQMSLRRTGNPEEYLGQTLSFHISRYDEQGRNIVVSRRSLLEEERRQQQEALKQTLKEGMTVRGTITSLRDFGAFIDIGGIEGLIPVSEVGWGRVEEIRDELAVGQEVDVAVKSLDWENQRFSFSIKETLADPWGRAADRFAEGSVHRGRVARLAPFGAFVTLEEGVDGLVHISKLGRGKRISHPREAVREGDVLEVKVDSVDVENRRISLTPVEAGGAGEKAPEPEERTFVEKSGSMGTLGDLLKSRLGPAGKKR
jgi:small subunit ribosomal protein S1